ncbi:hypothetical protein PUN28_017985 [Cardiocondyla obscurior]|uniref:Uncharacterized protein n=1 Tax=Cardiocondyla obscurior TaxID=286306 RepID=A0AAW2EFB0_9HYME
MDDEYSICDSSLCTPTQGNKSVSLNEFTDFCNRHSQIFNDSTEKANPSPLQTSTASRVMELSEDSAAAQKLTDKLFSSSTNSLSNSASDRKRSIDSINNNNKSSLNYNVSKKHAQASKNSSLPALPSSSQSGRSSFPSVQYSNID